MSIAKRKPRCGWCYQLGHNRTSCPDMKKEAENGNAFAKERLERSKIKKCSYCKSEEHTKATCDVKFNDDLNDGWKTWAGINAALEVIKQKKIGKGAFIYGPIMHRWSELPRNVLDRDGVSKPNYELINFVITHSHLDVDNVNNECTGHFSYQTLAEPEDPTVRLKYTYSIPGFFKAVESLPDAFERGKARWLAANKSNNWDDTLNSSRKSSDELCQVIVEAPQEEIDALVNSLLALKPTIVDFTDRKAYQTELRRLKKNEKTDSED